MNDHEDPIETHSLRFRRSDWLKIRDLGYGDGRLAPAAYICKSLLALSDDQLHERGYRMEKDGGWNPHRVAGQARARKAKS